MATFSFCRTRLESVWARGVTVLARQVTWWKDGKDAKDGNPGWQSDSSDFAFCVTQWSAHEVTLVMVVTGGQGPVHAWECAQMGDIHWGL